MEQLGVLKWREGINLKNLDRLEIFEAIQKIDHTVFHEGGFSEIEDDIARYEVFRDGYLFAVYEGKIVGYFNWFPITKVFYDDVVKGEQVYDGDIKSSYISGLKDDCTNYIFLLSLAVLPEYQGQGISKEFSKIMATEFAKLSSITDIVAYAYTPGGEHFANGFGLKVVKILKHMDEDIKLMRLS